MSEDFTTLPEESGEHSAEINENPAESGDTPAPTDEALADDREGHMDAPVITDIPAADDGLASPKTDKGRLDAVMRLAGAVRHFFRKDSMPNLVLTLGTVSLCAALLLSIIFRLTEPKILASKKKAADSALGTVFAAELSFRPSPYDSRVFEGRDENGELQGFSVRVAPVGYGGEMDMIVGVSLGLEITGVTIVSHRESAGYGDKLTEQTWFLEQFIGQSEDIRPGGSVDGISGATRSSNAVIEGAAQARQIVLDLVTEDLEDRGAAG